MNVLVNQIHTFRALEGERGFFSPAIGSHFKECEHL